MTGFSHEEGLVEGMDHLVRMFDCGAGLVGQMFQLGRGELVEIGLSQQQTKGGKN